MGTDEFTVDDVAGALADADVIDNWRDGQDRIVLRGVEQIWHKVVDAATGRLTPSSMTMRGWTMRVTCWP